MLSNSNKILTHIRPENVYKLRKIISDDERKVILEQALIKNPKLNITRQSSDYRKSYDIIMRNKQEEYAKYQNSLLWSTRFTPWHFKYMFLIPAICVAALITYIRYIAQPRQMMRLKKRYGIKFKELQAKGWLDGWMDQYHKTDQVLRFQAYTLADMEALHKEGILTSKKMPSKKKQSKFIRGDKEFVLKDFKTA